MATLSLPPPKLVRSASLPAAYFGFYLPVGVLFAYLPAFFTAKGMSAAQVGWLLAGVFGVKVVAGPVVAWLGDVSGRQRLMLLAAVVASMGATSVLLARRDFLALMAAVVVMSCCRNYAQVVIEAAGTAARDAAGSRCYGRMRAWGSLGVCVGVLLSGVLPQLLPACQGVAVPWLVLVSAALVGAVGVCGFDARAAAPAPAVPLPQTSGHAGREATPTVALLLAGAALLIGANGVLYGGATLLLTLHGVPATMVALLWLFAFGVEAVGFRWFDRVRARCGDAKLFLLLVALSLCRWGLFMAAPHAALIVLAFGLHVASYSWMQALVASWVRAAWPDHYAATGQAMYTACAQGIGVATLSGAASALLPRWGAAIYTIAAAATAAGALVMAARWHCVRYAGRFPWRKS